MKTTIIGIFVTVLTLMLLQPLLEIANVLKEKVTLGTAILNSCRAARNNAIASFDDYFDGYSGDHKIGDLNAYIDEDMFREFFTEAFAETLRLNKTYSSGGEIRFDSTDGRWGRITVFLSWDYDDTNTFDYDFTGRMMNSVTIRIETPYVFRTGLLQTVVGAAGYAGGSYNITETRTFIVQIIN